jgi:hypothetical protein
MNKPSTKKESDLVAMARQQLNKAVLTRSSLTSPPSTGVSSGSLKITEVPIPTDTLFDQRINDFTKTVERMRCLAAFERALDIFKEQVMLNVRFELDRVEKKKEEEPPHYY